MQEKRLSRILGIYRSNPSGSVLKVWKSYPESFYKKLVNKRFFLKIRDNPTFGITKYVFNIMASMQSGYRRALLAKSEIAECTYTCCACYSTFPHDSKCHFLNGNRRQPPPCLPKSKTDGCCQWRRSRSS